MPSAWLGFRSASRTPVMLALGPAEAILGTLEEVRVWDGGE